jgi:hypothetical protein
VQLRIARPLLLAGLVAFAGPAQAEGPRQLLPLAERERPPATPIPGTVAQACCMRCSAGCPCGNSCISCAKSCHKGPGCACGASGLPDRLARGG